METATVANATLLFAPEPPVLPEDKTLVDAIAEELAALVESGMKQWDDIREHMIFKYNLTPCPRPCYAKYVLIGDKFVVKVSLTIDSEKPIGTIYTRRINFDGWSPITVQPRANTENKESIREFLYNTLKNLGHASPTDMHYGNVGEYNGHAVIFDW